MLYYFSSVRKNLLLVEDYASENTPFLSVLVSDLALEVKEVPKLPEEISFRF